MKESPIKLPVRVLGRLAPTVLRFLAHHNPVERGRWSMLSALMEDPDCRKWLAGLENPTRTRRGFRIFTLPGDLTSDWIKLHGQHEAGTERFLLDHLKPGTTFLDIGANVGYFSLLAATAGQAKSVAFEPQKPVAELLERSVVHNGLQDRVKVEQIALSDTPAVMKMSVSPGNSGHSQLVGADDARAQGYSVQVVVFDKWAEASGLGSVSVCKIDTEGVELQVLRGMRRQLERDSPAIVIEVMAEFLAEFGSSDAEVIALLKSLDYTDVTGDYHVRGDSNRYFIRK